MGHNDLSVGNGRIRGAARGRRFLTDLTKQSYGFSSEQSQGLNLREVNITLAQNQVCVIVFTRPRKKYTGLQGVVSVE